MSRRNDQHGFTIIELSIVMVLVGLISTGVYFFINTTLSQYLALHADSSEFGDLAYQSQRVANVVRGLTDVTEATNDGMTMYAYFYPQDAYVSQIKYYKSNGKLLADVIPLTANPPIGVLQPSKLKTYTVIQNLKSLPGVNMFTYLDSAGAVLATPIADLHTIKGVKVSLSVPTKAPSANGDNTITLSVSLRNRKTNL